MENTVVPSRSNQDRNVFLAQDFDRNTEARCSTCDDLVNVHKWMDHKRDCSIKRSQQCDLCTFEYNHVVNLQIHKLLKHPSGCKECSICKKKFQRDSAFRGHVISHFVLDKLGCAHCKDEFDTPVELSRHRRLLHSDNATMTEALICCYCGEIFSPLELDTHKRRHTYERVLQKKIVPARKSSKTNFSRPAIRAHICSVCERTFRRPKELERHEAIHSEDRNYKCAYCSMEFRHKNVLLSHEKLHKRTNKVYNCRICHHNFNTKYNLHRHLQITHMETNNEGAREEKTMDEMNITDNSNTNLHLVEDREGNFPDTSLNSADGKEKFRRREEELGDEWNELQLEDIQQGDWRWDMDGVTGCDLAEQLFENRESEKDRMMVIRGNYLKCPACTHSIESIEHMMAHFQSMATSDSLHRLATFTCIFCQKEMMGAEVSSHLNSHGITPYSRSVMSMKSVDRPHLCTTCLRSFTKNIDLIRHIRTHTGEKPFMCKMCGERFRVETTLRRHQKMHQDMEATNECSLCGKGFLNKNTLRIHMITHTTPCSFCHKTFNSKTERDEHILREHSNREMGLMNRTGGMLLPSVPGGLATLSQISRPSECRRRLIPTGPSAFYSIPSTSNEETKNEKFDVKIRAEDATKEEMIMILSRKRVERPSGSSSHSNKSSYLSFFVPHQLLSSLQVEGGVLRTPINHGKVVNMHPSETLSALNSTDRMDMHPVESQSLQASSTSKNQNARSVSFIPIDVNSHNYFVDHCNICDVSFSSKEESDVHMTSEDHETAMLLAPNSEMESSNSMVCKLCGNRFASMAPLVDHIRREHERDHPKSLAPLNLHTSLLTSSNNHVHT